MTLLEVSLVLFLMVLFLGLALPRFSLLFQSPLDKDALRIQTLVSRLKKEALLEGRGFKLVLDSAKGEVLVYEQDGADPETYRPYLAKGLSGFALEPGVQMKPVQKQRDRQFQMGFKSLSFDPIFGLESEVFIDRAGLMDLFSLELADGKQRLFLEVKDVMGVMSLTREAVGP
ncbi:MAG: hypothetical protein A2600_07420 [Candidatus Lambdaproteobacteria bacterium RIFOXYD1_FULL_56_27]|uniref:General secretion pathway GspH domain-containing protein n=1 Tax=Candidatus Lambdaproteobacteria bacterium RIFOXYD2_FULL_56_26 TaxID=1817773 RepID=A0A1F6GVN1_9PROT|nr:MAG: hypothetical protein A2557_05325 [Candidatus Lambdaproteobacteria bacterium RIFOXYD2_FULL_56_26]OGH03758.1 MAG: hypothetical protein A2426_00870 [Candidatus Lambdaproteobacteria bacterium RIFOXYC1_FULL_56_13]OGH07342.1 MAG: hypothetical protein A2600_07420 [Candidatus Lambdaproteobacteria bacterium RIFOXYD1_FULL_56_27]